MTDNRTTELLPCPFCGGEARTSNERFERTLLLWVYCSSCGAAAGYRGTEAEAIAAWNTRTERVDERKTINKTGDFVTHDSGECENVWDVELTGRLRFQCSECGAVSLEITPRFCPHCGAKVVDE